MNISCYKFPRLVNNCVRAVKLLLMVCGSTLSFFLAGAHVGTMAGAIVAVLTAVFLFWAGLPAFVQRQITFGLAASCGLQVRQYESLTNGVSYFVVGPEDGLRYFIGVGAIGPMESYDWFNEHEFQTLKAGGTLPY